MKKLLIAVLTISMVLFAGSAMADWSAYVGSQSTVGGYTTPGVTVQPWMVPGGGGVTYKYSVPVQQNTIAGSGIVTGGVYAPSNFTKTFTHSGFTSTGGSWTQNGGISVNQTQGSTTVKAWSSSFSTVGE